MDDLDTLKSENLEFNFTVEMDVIQAVKQKDAKERKVGFCTATFHIAPKALMRQRKAKLAERKKARRLKKKMKQQASDKAE